ncbi:MAG: hypothetical protein KBA81_07050 [Rhabdochlamydiaceae bacterium]|nr:hypothetical protein [Rhabdochlamydiaceae bacterium]
MIRFIPSYLFHAVPRSLSSMRLYSQATANADKQFSKATLEKRALELIFGSKDYTALTSREKRMVDLYQERVYQESCGCVVLPNTKMDLEQRTVEQLQKKQ